MAPKNAGGAGAGSATSGGAYGMMRGLVTLTITYSLVTIMWSLVKHRNFFSLWVCVVTSWGLLAVPSAVAGFSCPLEVILIVALLMLSVQGFDLVKQHLSCADHFARRDPEVDADEALQSIGNVNMRTFQLQKR